MKGITQSLRSLRDDTSLTVYDMTRPDLYRIARRIGIKITVAKIIGGFIVKLADNGVGDKSPYALSPTSKDLSPTDALNVPELSQGIEARATSKEQQTTLKNDPVTSKQLTQQDTITYPKQAPNNSKTNLQSEVLSFDHDANVKVETDFDFGA